MYKEWLVWLFSGIMQYADVCMHGRDNNVTPGEQLIEVILPHSVATADSSCLVYKQGQISNPKLTTTCRARIPPIKDAMCQYPLIT